MNIGVSSITFPFDKDNLSLVAKEGIGCIELSFSERQLSEYSARVAVKTVREASLTPVSFHLPFGMPTKLELAAEDIAVRKRTTALYCKLIREYAAEGITKFIIHPSSEPVSNDPVVRKKRLSDARDALASLAEVAALHGAEIAVENLPRTCLGNSISEMEYLISGSSRLGICFDTNHLLTDTNEELVGRLGKRITSLHVSDYDRINERHWLPGEGDINWHGLYGMLTECGYTGTWLYEVINKPKTILRERSITPGDLVKNAHSIFNSLPIETFSKRIPGLGMWP